MAFFVLHNKLYIITEGGILMSYPATKDEFKAETEAFQATDRFRPPMLFAIGAEARTKYGTLASMRYPVVNGPGQGLGTAAKLMEVLEIEPLGVQDVTITPEIAEELLKHFRPFLNDGGHHPNVQMLEMALLRKSLHERSDGVVNRQDMRATFIFDDVPPQDVPDSTLKLYGISHRHFKPNSLDFTEVFKKLPTVTWMGDRPMDEREVDEALMQAAFLNGSFAPEMVDKFPFYIHRINSVKMGVRIADQHKVRLGAYLGEGTTLMPGASYINFNAGVEGPGMIEGRVSSKAFVGAGTDVGGGASMLGVLSGGNNLPIWTGRNCTLEVNCTLGIPIGDCTIIGANVSVLAGSRVRINVKEHPRFGEVVKALELAGVSGMTFRRNDKDGGLEMVRVDRNLEAAEKLKDGKTVLNTDLHAVV